ncbi:MAG: excinuclease ABC subunit UvrA [Planctomycetota bacterium]
MKKGNRSIVVRGAAEHNLRGFDVEIPRNRLTVVTGLSGSGKSSLAYDIIYREGQRRFVESLSAYARQYLGKLDKPRVEHIEGLSPTISIDQKTISRNPRSTVGTITEILDHLRLLYSRLGTPHCPECGDPITSRTVDQIVDVAYRDWPGQEVLVCAPIILDRKGEYRKELSELREQGFVRARVDGTVHRLDEEIELARYERHTIEVVYDRIRLDPERRPRFTESVEKALALADGLVDLVVNDEQHLLSARFACASCGNSVPELEPRLFSFNSHGACTACNGLGRGYAVAEESLVPDPELSLSEDAICTFHEGVCEETGLALDELEELGFDTEIPWRKIRKATRNKLLFGDKKGTFRGLAPQLIEAATWSGARSQPSWLVTERCGVCDGSRLGRPARAVLFRNRNIAEVTAATVGEAEQFFESLQLDGNEALVGAPIVTEVLHRLRFLQSVGLSYLTLERSADTLSGGEAQRIRLASQLGSGLRGVLYVLDEPSIGLHPRDNRALIETLRRLRDLGNTVLVVEHDQETIEAADHIVDVGPGAGSFGGELVASGSLSAVKKTKQSLTGRYLRGLDQIEVPEQRRAPGRGAITIRGARQHNLRNVDVEIPLGAFVGVVGVSGSGKSTLVDQILYRTAMRHVGWLVPPPGEHDDVDGLDAIDKVIRIDQSPIGRTPRSNPGTYTKVFDEIRALFARIPEAKVRGYQKGRFSFNVKGGRCENCGGAGVNTISMQFLASVEVICEECNGRRYTRETLEINYRGLSIYDVLELPISEGAEFFRDLPKIHRVLQTLVDVGLGYVKIGQPSTTLSGGEAQLSAARVRV